MYDALGGSRGCLLDRRCICYTTIIIMYNVMYISDERIIV